MRWVNLRKIVLYKRILKQNEAIPGNCGIASRTIPDSTLHPTGTVGGFGAVAEYEGIEFGAVVLVPAGDGQGVAADGDDEIAAVGAAEA